VSAGGEGREVEEQTEFPFPSLYDLALQTPLLTTKKTRLGDDDAIMTNDRAAKNGVAGRTHTEMDTHANIRERSPDGKKRGHYSLGRNITPDLVKHRKKKQK
jgi:hypothetical protein